MQLIIIIYYYDYCRSDVMQLITEFDCKGVNFEKPEHLNDLFININCDPMHVINEIVVCSEV